MRTEVRIAGFGGQGVIMAGVIIGKAASLFDNKNAVQTQSMSHEALIKYMGDLKDEGVLIIDPDMIVEEEIADFVKEHNIKLYRAPATKTATEDVGLRIVANIVMIGAIVKATEVVSVDAAKQAILDSVPKGTEDKNIQAFEAGYALI